MVRQLAILSILAVAVIAATGTIGTASAAGEIAQGFTLGEVLDESIGWFIVVGLGAVFAVVISLEIKIEEKYLGVTKTSEWSIPLAESSRLG